MAILFVYNVLYNYSPLTYSALLQIIYYVKGYMKIFIVPQKIFEGIALEPTDTFRHRVQYIHAVMKL